MIVGLDPADLVGCSSCLSLFICSDTFRLLSSDLPESSNARGSSNINWLEPKLYLWSMKLWDLSDNCYKYSSRQHTNEAKNYIELLGQANYFSLHVLFAILSFLVFGMVPTVANRYSFHETNDKDFKLVMAATTSLLCVLLLAILKAYINKCTSLEYFKMVVYYIIIAVSVLGVSYVVGNLAARLMEEHGWFNTSSGGDMTCLPRAIIPNLESF
ncbi:hypothetical protein E3N88_30249 [Mikania micrantha]|uniref:Uncharacterized protein n=1 Tax=Mikania micrantha TaxID=192012 RepID=A0A5N6MLS1_9ASTR|nr:hypothetical protein E3N88_30249 [Mikania micrantha]